MTDRPHPDLDAPLSEAEAAECARVGRAETWRIGGGNPMHASDGTQLVAVLAGDADAIDAHCRFVCWAAPNDADRIVVAVNGDALADLEREIAASTARGDGREST